MRRIADSPLFDLDRYLAQIGRQLSREAAVRDYVQGGEALDLQPSPHFEPRFYRQAYADVAKSEDNLLNHYIAFGQAEARYPTRAVLAADAAFARQRMVEPKDVVNSAQRSEIAGLSRLERHLVVGWKLGDEVLSGFNDLTYFRLYSDVAASRLPPLIHFLRFGLDDGRSAPSIKGLHDVVRRNIDEDFYRIQAPDIQGGDAALDYLTLGRWSGCDPLPELSTDYYLERHPDLLRGSIDPLKHYVDYGKVEGRIARPDFSGWFRQGDRVFDPGKPTLLVATHETTRTGAPLVALKVGEYFSESYNIIYHTMRAGAIMDDFLASSVLVVTGPLYGIDAEYLLDVLKTLYSLEICILNSVETFELSEGALQVDLPCIALVHEFSEYSAGRVGRMCAAADRVVVPARLLLESAQRELVRDYAAPSNNVVVRPQGLLAALPSDGDFTDLDAEEILATIGHGTRIVLGAGFVHIRKGIDIFIQTAAEVRRLCGQDIRFVWVGHGYHPEVDFTYSLWLKETLERLDLQGVVFFLPAQSSLDVIFELSSAFYLPSRLDPYPNVVLDALEAGKPVVCFDRATGASELFQDGTAVGAAVDYGDIAAAARALAGFLDSPHSGAPNRELVHARFNFDDYGAFLAEEMHLARRLRADQIAVFERLEGGSAFNASFHEGAPLRGAFTRRALRRYVSRSFKGLSRLNPRPGFSDNLYKSQHDLPLDGHEVALDHALRTAPRTSSEAPPRTHDCTILTSRPPPRLFKGRIALHLHLFYAELAEEFAERLARTHREIDLFVTTNSHRKALAIENAFSGYRRGRVSILETPNRGRDIGPFITLLERPILEGGYDLVGHLHGKKSLAVETIVPGLGDRWREYVLSLLLGPRPEFEQVLALFGQDPALGLVFAEDRNAVGWAGNLEIAESLADRLERKPVLPRAPFYPLGSMFWGRPAALAPLWKLGLTFADYPGEPLPYDGTVLHAVERMLPSVAEAAGYSWRTVYKPGLSW